jgi:hypothetical protein
MPEDFLMFAGSQYADFGPLISSISFLTDQPFALLAGGVELIGKATCVCGNAAAPGLPAVVAAAGA